MMESCRWVRGEEIGHGSFASVSKARVLGRNDVAAFPSLLAVKSCDASLSNSLREEKRILDGLRLSPRIVRCFGDGFSVENGQSLYNLFLELASEGTLADMIERQHGVGVGLAESDVRRLTRAILEGLSGIHKRGFVHCDIKPHNILLFADGSAKISDFGLSKEKDAKTSKFQLRGTPLYIAPESVKANEYEAPCDVWALGCVVAEMATGKTAWDHSPASTIWTLLKRIAGDEEIPEIPRELSEEGRDFLRKCFVKNPRERWTARQLLSHPFVADHGEHGLWKTEEAVSSPTCPFGFCELDSDSESPLPSPTDHETSNWSVSHCRWISVS